MAHGGRCLLLVPCGVARRRAPPGGVSPPGLRCLVLPHERGRDSPRGLPRPHAVAHRRGGMVVKNCRALCCRVLRSGLQSRVKRSAQGKKGTRPRVIAQSALYIYMGTPLRARPRHRVIVRAQNTCKPGRGRYRGAGRGNSKNCKQGTRSGQIGARHCVIVHSAKAGPWSVARAAVQSMPCPPWRVAVISASLDAACTARAQ